MDERPLIPSAPTASRVDRFRDAAGMNAFRDMETPVDASLAEATPTNAARDVYESPRGAGVRAAQRGDFSVSRTSRATITTVSAALVLASMPLGWGGFALGFSGFMEYFWLAFIALWFFAGLTASLAMWLLARSDWQAVRCGVIAEDERVVVVRAVWTCRVALAASGISFAAVMSTLFW